MVKLQRCRHLGTGLRREERERDAGKLKDRFLEEEVELISNELRECLQPND